jgi:hypothetical protein
MRNDNDAATVSEVRALKEQISTLVREVQALNLVIERHVQMSYWLEEERRKLSLPPVKP